jgi:hypothetical protein
MGSGGGGGRTVAVTFKGAFGSHTHHPGSFQHCLYSLWFVDLVKREEEGDGRGFVGIRFVSLVVIPC